jgi:hypothetical protein
VEIPGPPVAALLVLFLPRTHAYNDGILHRARANGSFGVPDQVAPEGCKMFQIGPPPAADMLSHYCAEGAVSFATCANNISVSTRVGQPSWRAKL